MGSREQIEGELCAVGFLGETPDAAVTGHQEKLLRPKVRVRVRKAKKKKKIAEGGSRRFEARGREVVFEKEGVELRGDGGIGADGRVSVLLSSDFNRRPVGSCGAF